jgi:hypothetical protein
MALVVRGVSTCAICGRLADDLPYLATSGVFFPPGDPLFPFCDAPLHWDCYEHWPERSRFARQYVSSRADGLLRNEYWGEALRTDLVHLSVRRKEPGEAWVWLFETGTCVRVPLFQWSSWLWDPSLSQDELHRLEITSLAKVLPTLRQQFPKPETVLAAVDWKAKERLGQIKEEHWVKVHQAHLDAIQAHNDACRDFVRTTGEGGLTCPHCRRQSNDIEFVDHGEEDRKSFFVCRGCSRSFGHDL